MSDLVQGIAVLGSKFRPVCEFYYFTINLAFHSPAEADCIVSNARMFKGQSSDGGTFDGQLVQWSVKIVRELLSFFPFKRRGGKLLPQSSSLSQPIT